MPIPLACPQCNRPLTAPDDAAGRKAKCTHCGTQFRVPESYVPTVPEAEKEPPPAMIDVACPHCRAIHQLREEHCGRPTRCNTCLRTFEAPYPRATIVRPFWNFPFPAHRLTWFLIGTGVVLWLFTYWAGPGWPLICNLLAATGVLVGCALATGRRWPIVRWWGVGAAILLGISSACWWPFERTFTRRWTSLHFPKKLSVFVIDRCCMKWLPLP